MWCAELFKTFSQVSIGITRRFGGTGLGLAISKHLAEMMGGRMWYERRSGPGTGSKFAFSIVCPGSFQRIPPYLRGLDPNLANRKLLIIKSNERAGMIVGQTVAHWGMHPTVVQTVGQVEELLAEKKRYDVILLDYELDHPRKDGSSDTASHSGDSPATGVDIVAEEENAEEEHSLSLIQSPGSNINFSSETHRVHSRVSTGEISSVVGGLRSPRPERRSSVDQSSTADRSTGGSTSGTGEDAAREMRRSSVSGVILPAAGLFGPSVSSVSISSPPPGSRTVSAVTGFDVSTVIRARHVNPDVPIIMLISLSARQRQMRDVISIFLSLPLKYSKLYYALGHALRRKGSKSSSSSVAPRQSAMDSPAQSLSGLDGDTLLSGDVNADEMGVSFDSPASTSTSLKGRGDRDSDLSEGEPLSQGSPAILPGHLRVNINTPNTNARTVVKKAMAGSSRENSPAFPVRGVGSNHSSTVAPSPSARGSAAAQAGGSDDAGSQFPLRILVAEDNVINRKVISKMLERLGYTNIDLAEHGRIAVDRVVAEVRRAEQLQQSTPREASSLTQQGADTGGPFGQLHSTPQLPPDSSAGGHAIVASRRHHSCTDLLPLLCSLQT